MSPPVVFGLFMVVVAGIVGLIAYETWRPECRHLHCPDRRQRWHRHPEDAMW